MKKFILPIIVIILIALGAIVALFNRQANLLGSNSLTATNSSLEDFYRTAEQLAGKTEESAITFLAVGDIMLSRNVAGTAEKSGNTELPFSALNDVLLSTDFNFGNLESPVSGRSDFNPTGSLVFNAPPQYAKPLAKYNFKILNLANNHAMDQGKAGLDNTGKFLEGLGIEHIGAGGDLDEAWQGKVVESKGLKIGFIGASYSSVNDGGKATNNYVARIEDVIRLKANISKLKTAADFIVVTMHAGTEYTRTPNQSQVDFAHTAIDAGADLVIGAHPHWIQTIETYQGKYIFYSLGNFIFDQMWSQDTKEGLILKITLVNNKQTGQPNAAQIDDLQGNKLHTKVKQIELIPVIIENYSTPRLANDQEKENVFKKIGVTSSILITQ